MASVLCEPCTTRAKQTTAVQWCSDCEEFLCHECIESHRSMRISRDHQLVEINKMPQVKNFWSKSCEKHEVLQLEYFCTYHDVLCCKECLADSHRTCEKVMSVDIASKDARTSESFLESVEQIGHVLKSLEDLITNQKLSIKNLEHKIKKAQKEIAKAKEKLMEHIDSLERSLLEELEQTKDKYLSKMRKRIADAQHMTVLSKEHESVLNFVKEHGSDKQAFLLVRGSEDILEDIQTKVKKLSETMTEVNLQFNKSPLKDSDSSIGRINVTETQLTSSFVQRKQLQSQVSFTKKHKISSLAFLHDVNLTEIQEYTITGMTVYNTSLLMCDVKRSRIVMCDKCDNYQCSIDTMYKPWDIATTPGTAIVSSSERDYIQFIDLDRKKVTEKQKVKDCSKGGISTTVENIFVGANGKIHVLSLGGLRIRTIDVSSSGTICYLYSSLNGFIPFCDGSDTVRCINSDGKVLFTYNSPSLKMSRKLVIDGMENIYIVGQNSHNIHRLSRDGTFTDIILDDDDLYYPHTICFNKDYTKFYVASKYCGVRVFRVD